MGLQLVGASPADLDVVLVDAPGAWVEKANCRGVDPDLFFLERGASTHAAKAVCAGCTVRVECLDHAMAVPERFGIWGGQSEKERRANRRKLIAVRRATEMGRRA